MHPGHNATNSQSTERLCCNSIFKVSHSISWLLDQCTLSSCEQTRRKAKTKVFLDFLHTLKISQSCLIDHGWVPTYRYSISCSNESFLRLAAWFGVCRRSLSKSHQACFAPDSTARHRVVFFFCFHNTSLRDLITLHWWRKVGKDRCRRKNPAPTTSWLWGMCSTAVYKAAPPNSIVHCN